MAGDRVARSVNKFIYIRVGGQILRIYPPLNKPKTLAPMPFRSLVLRTMTRWTDKNITVDSKVIISRFQIKSGLTTIKFFPTAHHAQSKSVAEASIADTHTHATRTHLLSPQPKV